MSERGVLYFIIFCLAIFGVDQSYRYTVTLEEKNELQYVIDSGTNCVNVCAAMLDDIAY